MTGLETFTERFWTKVDQGDVDSCWHWRGCVSRNGYGRVAAGFHLGGPKVWNASRVAYTLAVGPVPAGAELDHVCHSRDTGCSGGPCAHRSCVNPSHLEPVTHLENALRRESRLSTCINGHPKTAENRSPNGPQGATKCKVCHRERARARRAVA